MRVGQRRGNRVSHAAPRDIDQHNVTNPGSEAPPGGLTLSVVIPTRNEAANIEELVNRVEQATQDIRAEVIFVDDSTDDTPSVISEVRRRHRLPVSLIHRPPERRGNGLGGAVVEGMRAATGDWVCVMDGDLQHPPEMLPRILDAAREAASDIVVASRYAVSGASEGLGVARAALSKLSTLAARILFPRRLSQVKDPLSGYFMVRRRAVDPARMRPRGFKILMDIMVRFPHLRVAEVPFRFDTRKSGQSKAGMREGLRYLRLLLQLRFGSVLERGGRFVLVGASGIIVNSLLLAGFTDTAGMYYVASAVLATIGSSLWNFFLTDAWVFGDRPAGRPRMHRLGSFMLLNMSALVLRGPFLVILTSGLGAHYLFSNLITLLALSLGRYTLSDRWIWAELGSNADDRPSSDNEAGDEVGRGEAAAAPPPNYSYDIHGIVRVASEVRLPELEYFRTSDPLQRPDVIIESRRSRSPENGLSKPQSVNGSQPFRFGEILGRLGFWVEITWGDQTRILASPLLKRSPHVLYTNVVEPILRWTLVRHGYALVHAACVARDGEALLITAATDTGKTTTILRMLSRHSLDFLSDDMVILGRTGELLSYPKPLTISRHTLSAVGGAPLSPWARLALQVQSRVHSKSGRQSALLLARMPLPMASINALIQILIPPPKYSIDQLIPGVEIARKATVTQMVVIERGDDLQVSLDRPTANQTLLRNCEDAYGFPPYPSLKPVLISWDGVDLQGVEREIISSGLGNRAATLIRSQTRSWWQNVLVLLMGADAELTTVSDGEAIPAPKKRGRPSASTEVTEGTP